MAGAADDRPAVDARPGHGGRIRVVVAGAVRERRHPLLMARGTDPHPHPHRVHLPARLREQAVPGRRRIHRAREGHRALPGRGRPVCPHLNQPDRLAYRPPQPAARLAASHLPAGTSACAQRRPEVEETIKRSVLPFLWLQGNICSLLAAKDHVNVFIYDPHRGPPTMRHQQETPGITHLSPRFLPRRLAARLVDTVRPRREWTWAFVVMTPPTEEPPVGVGSGADQGRGGGTP
jgi:hypothetical protein